MKFVQPRNESLIKYEIKYNMKWKNFDPIITKGYYYKKRDLKGKTLYCEVPKELFGSWRRAEHVAGLLHG